MKTALSIDTVATNKANRCTRINLGTTIEITCLQLLSLLTNHCTYQSLYFSLYFSQSPDLASEDDHRGKGSDSSTAGIISLSTTFSLPQTVPGKEPLVEVVQEEGEHKQELRQYDNMTEMEDTVAGKLPSGGELPELPPR